MSDITKCQNSYCKLKEKCLRWIASPNQYYQSYAMFEPLNGKCDMLLEVTLCETYKLKK